MRLWLVRHGETEANVAGLYSGHAPTPLTEKGIGQAKTLHTLLRHVPFDRVLCSELERARHTARLVLEGRDVPQHILPELNEMYFGDWEMRHHRDLTHEDAESYAAWCTDWQNAVPTNGEGFQAFTRRVERFISRLDAFSDCQKPADRQPSGRTQPVDCPSARDARRLAMAFPGRTGMLERNRHMRRVRHPESIK